MFDQIKMSEIESIGFLITPILRINCFNESYFYLKDGEMNEQIYRALKTHLPSLKKISHLTRIKYSNGTYEGYFINGKKDGHSKFEWISGHKYIGEFKEDKRTGRGSFFFANGL